VEPRASLAGLALACAALLSCAHASPGERPPRGQLPQDTRPIEYRLELAIDPTTPRFSGRVPIVDALSPALGAGLLTAASGFGSRDAVTAVNEWFAERAPVYPGGPRALAGLVERIQLCAARVEHQRPSALSLLEGEAGT
jgi:hypothetical protein